VDEVRAAEGPIATAALLVVTDDRDLRHALRLKGARTAGAAWLLGRLERTERPRPGRASSADPGSAIGTGRKRPTSSPGMTRPKTTADLSSDDLASDADDIDDRPGWQPGRGATTKRGNPRRTPRRRTG
jgi:hypothetical protein